MKSTDYVNIYDRGSSYDHLIEETLRTGDNIRLRKDRRFEAGYIKSCDENGKIQYGYCYGQSYEEAKEKREYQLKKVLKRKQLNFFDFGKGGSWHRCI